MLAINTLILSGMYQDYYGLKSAPFTAKPDRQFIFTSADFNRIYTSLRIGLREEYRCNVLTGEVGAGKTTLLNLLCQDSSWQVHWVSLPYVNLSFAEMIDLICDRLAITLPSGEDTVAALIAELSQQRRQGVMTVLVIDEAQNLPHATLTDLLALVVKANHAPWLQILLVGQPGLDKVVKEVDASLAADTADQKAFRYHCLPALRKTDVGAYIKHRLIAAGNELGMLFNSQAVALIADHSGGIPRIINSICGYALLIGQEQAVTKINDAIVSEAVQGLGLQLNRENIVDVDLSQTIETAAPIVDLSQTVETAIPEGIAISADERLESVQTIEVAAPEVIESVDLQQTQEIAAPAITEPMVQQQQEPRQRRRRRRQSKSSHRHVIGVISVALLVLVLAFVVGAYTVNDFRNTSISETTVVPATANARFSDLEPVPYREIIDSKSDEPVKSESAITPANDNDKALPVDTAVNNRATEEDKFVDKIVLSDTKTVPQTVNNTDSPAADDKTKLKRATDHAALQADNHNNQQNASSSEPLPLQIKPADTESATQVALATDEKVKPGAVTSEPVERQQDEQAGDEKEINNEVRETDEQDYVAELEASEQRQGLTIQERLALWQKVAEQVDSSEIKQQVEEKLQYLQAIVKDSATIREEDHFITCKTVTNWQPIGIGRRFSTGKVALLARVHSPKEEETLTVSWHDSKGQILHAKPVTVRRNIGGGYRLYFWKRFDHTGLFEVRLYNEAQHLIGRRAFLVE